MAQVPLFDELNRLITVAGIEIRTESFRLPPDSAGGLCRIRGRDLVLLHSGASHAERAEALIEVLEHLGLERLGLKGSDLSAALLARLNRRGQISWPGREQLPSLSKTAGVPGRSHLRIVPSPPSLATLTTLGVGGAPDDFIRAQSEDQVREAARAVKSAGDVLYALGGGSNLVVSDKGIDGTVLKVDIKGISAQSRGDELLVTAGAGEIWHDFAERMSNEGYAGLECLGGIPGSVGATPLQNVGAYGQEVSQTIENVRVLDRASLEVRNFDNASCNFGYRTSCFKTTERDRYIVLSVTYRLKKNGSPTIHYEELRRRLGPNPPLTLREVFNTVVDLRRDKSMIHDPADENGRSCGSFFVNAQVSPSTVEAVAQKVGQRPPTYEAMDGLVKLPSAWLIEHAGIKRGFRLGRAGISTKHTLAIVAHPGATATEVIRVAIHVRDTVRSAFEIDLSPEPIFWGFYETHGGLPAV
jgi:UDP-N-acetylmuramate dehydrogenase